MKCHRDFNQYVIKLVRNWCSTFLDWHGIELIVIVFIFILTYTQADKETDEIYAQMTLQPVNSVSNKLQICNSNSLIDESQFIVMPLYLLCLSILGK